MKVALINPDNGKAIKKENLGLLYLATYLKNKGVEVRIIDEVAGDKSLDVLSSFSPDVVGISFMTMFANRAIKIAEQIRENFENIKIVFGGAHPTAQPDEFLDYTDAVIVGEGEITFLELLEKNKWDRKILQGKIEKDIDAFNIPDRSLINNNFYLAHKMGIAGISLKALSMSTSRGCPYRCIFCQNSKRTVPVRYHSVGRVIEEIRYLIQNYKVESIAFVDENFTFNKKRLRQICQQMINNNLNTLKWESQTSANVIDEETLLIMKKAGAIQVAFGFESGSQRILDVLKKHATIDQNRKAISLAKKFGLKVRGCFMIGNPTETIEDIEKTENFILENDIDYIGLFLTTPLPGTVLWDYCLENGMIQLDNINYDLFTTGTGVVPYACNTIKKEYLKKKYAKLLYLSMRKNYSPMRLLFKLFKYPKESFKIMKNMAKN